MIEVLEQILENIFHLFQTNKFNSLKNCSTINIVYFELSDI